MKNLSELKQNSAKISDAPVVFYRYTDSHEAEAKSSGVYDMNGSTLAFVDNGEVFVTNDTDWNEEILCENGFEQGFFRFEQSVMSRNDWKWQGLQTLIPDLKAKCEEWCDEHCIEALTEDVLAKCFEMPESGVVAKNLLYETELHPVKLYNVDSTRIGKYCYNNGKVVFVYRDGRTFVAKGYGILDLLEAAGYQRGSLFVPFSNGEVPTDSRIAKFWESLPKF